MRYILLSLALLASPAAAFDEGNSLRVPGLAHADWATCARTYKEFAFREKGVTPERVEKLVQAECRGHLEREIAKASR